MTQEEQSKILNEVSTIFDRVPRLSKFSLQVGLVANEQGRWQLALARILLSGIELYKSGITTYRSVVFIEKLLSVKAVRELITDVILNSRFKLDEYEVPFTARVDTKPTFWGNIEPGYWSSDGRALGIRWPSRIVAFYPSASSGLFVPRGLLLNKDKPLYPDAEAFLKHKFGVDIYRDSFRGSVILMIPNYTARIKEVSIGRTKLMSRFNRKFLMIKV